MLDPVIVKLAAPTVVAGATAASLGAAGVVVGSLAGMAMGPVLAPVAVFTSLAYKATTVAVSGLPDP